MKTADTWSRTRPFLNIVDPEPYLINVNPQPWLSLNYIHYNSTTCN
jgi:hypothetical protein